MTKETLIKLFEQKQIRSFCNKDEEKCCFSIVDAIQILTESSIPKRNWTDLKNKLKTKGSQLYYNIVHLKQSNLFQTVTNCH